MLTTILFDLDGTLLQMNQEKFIQDYFYELSRKIESMGLESKPMLKAIWSSTDAMIRNDGTRSNEDCFWEMFSSLLGDDMKYLMPTFEEFYTKEFHEVGKEVIPNSDARECITILKEKGYELVLATNPIFPRIATLSRLGWAGINVDEFVHMTTYETSRFCKPNLQYYQEILERIGKRSEECLMVGNDQIEDMCVTNLGMSAYLVSDHQILTTSEFEGLYQQGTLREFVAYCRALPCLIDTSDEVACACSCACEATYVGG